MIKKMSQKEFDNAYELHQQGKLIDFSDYDLTGVVLPIGAELTGAKFENCEFNCSEVNKLALSGASWGNSVFSDSFV